MRIEPIGDGQLIYLERSDWDYSGAPRRGWLVDPNRFIGLVSHHTVMVMGDWDGDGIAQGDLDDVRTYMRRLRTVRPDLGLDVPYSWVVFAGADGASCVVVEGRGKGRTGAHTAGLNSTRYGIAYAANTNEQPVSLGMVNGVRWIGATFLTIPAEAVVRTIGHFEVYATACPGTSGINRLPDVQPPFTIEKEEDDMQYISFGTRNDERMQSWDDGVSVLFRPSTRVFYVRTRGDGGVVAVDDNGGPFGRASDEPFCSRRGNVITVGVHQPDMQRDAFETVDV